MIPPPHTPGNTSLLTPTFTDEGQVDKTFIVLAIVLTFLITTIIVTLLVLALVWLCMTFRKKRSAKHNGSNKSINLAHIYEDIEE